MIIKANPWFMIMKGEIPSDNKFKLIQCIINKLSQKKKKDTTEDPKEAPEQPEEISYENLSEVDHDPEYQSYFYKTYGDEIAQYQTTIRKPKVNPQATLIQRDINPRCLAEALVKTKEAIKAHEDNPEEELDLPQIEVHHYSQPQKLESQHGKPAKH